MKLVVCAHWSDDADLDVVAAAMEPLKAPGTVGVAIAYTEGDPVAVETYEMLKGLVETEAP